MRYLVFGRTGVRVSELCLGALTFGEDWGWGASKSVSARLLDLYLDAGGNFIDTANRYTDGTSEAFLGELLGPRRDRVVLGTKFTMSLDDSDPNAHGNHRKHLVSALDASLRRLRTDYVDVLWVHARDALTPIEEVVRALDDQVRLGKVRYVGASNWSAWEAARAVTTAELRGWSRFAGVQVPYSLLNRSVEREMVPLVSELGLGITAYAPLQSGLLTGKYLRANDASGRLKDDAAAVDPRDAEIVEAVIAAAQALDATPAQVALAWLLARRCAVIPIIGATSEAQLRENLACCDVDLGPHLERLDALSAVDLGYPRDFAARQQRSVYGADPQTLRDGVFPGT